MTDHLSPVRPATHGAAFRLADHAVVLHRSATELQVGLDPRRALVLAATFRPVLDRLHAPTSRAELLTTGRAAGLSDREVTGAIRRLGESGLLRPGPTDGIGRFNRRVRLVGAGPVARSLTDYLVEGGVGELAVFAPGPGDPARHPGTAHPADGAAGPTDPPSARRSRVVQLDHWSKPEALAVDLTVIVAPGPEVDRLITDHLVRTDQPHLLVRSLGDAVWVGPLVVPGGTPCVRCTDLTRTDLDPSWPTVLAQLARRPIGLPALLAGWASAVAAAQTLAFLDGSRPETTGATLELTAAELRTELRTWPHHPRCGCRWPTSTEWGP